MFRAAGITVALCVGALAAAGAEADALAISANIQARHLPWGTIVDPFYASATSDTITGYTRCGDSAIWTGNYLAAEAYRYRVTADAAALENARRAVAGLTGLVDVTGTNLLARCRIAIGSPFANGIHVEEAANGVYTNSVAGYTWIGNTSRDQYCGVMFGFGVAYNLLPQTEIRAAIRETVTRLVTFLLDHNWTAPMPDGRSGTTFILRPDQQLGILQVARLVNPERFGAVYASQRDRQEGSVTAPVLFDSLSTSSYFKFNLIYITFFHLLGLEDGPARATYARAYAVARDYTAGHQNAFFNMVDSALFGPDARRDAETLVLLDLWLKRPRRDFFVDLRGAVPVCGDQACQPIPVDKRTPTDFLWQRSPFQLFGGSDGTIGNAGVDYILPYWMARYYGLLPAFRAQSAASSLELLAPDSLGSIYGTGLAGMTESATSPAESLGGIRLRITDSLGAARFAPLLFVSPGQVNFLVPAGTAAGPAQLAVVAMPGTTKTAPAVIASTAPALFTLDGHLAAATAVRVSGSAQSPVPVFGCTQSQCAAIPIDVSGQSVYLTIYGTGLRGRQSASAVARQSDLPVLYSGPQPLFPGLDQVNLALPAALAGAGPIEITLRIDGRAANPVGIQIR